MLVSVGPFPRRSIIPPPVLPHPPSGLRLVHTIPAPHHPDQPLLPHPSPIIPSCVHCNARMSAVPHTLQMVKTQRQQQQRGGNNTAHGSYFENAEMEQPMRYSSKMMNSIWGRYNENSVHNFKSLQCAGVAPAETLEAQQQAQQTPPIQRSVFNQRLGELGQAVAANFMDNLHQY
ncbi:uncharacterized protein [Panulirus ornatus]|uniref:uncharacterized protein n=1 Tax=Panulirus ornatus TaxID=150431 RepID=UPI003A849897